MARMQTLEVPIKGMDCAECTRHVQHAIVKLPGVESVDVLLATEKAIIRLDPDKVDLPAIRKAVAGAGDYSVPDTAPSLAAKSGFQRKLILLLAAVFSGILAIVIVGEGFGMFGKLNELIPFPIGVAIVLASGWRIFRNVIRTALKRRIISHTLMTLGVIAALVVGQWVTAAIVVIFMRVGDYVENFTTENARRAVKELTSIAPQTARVERDGSETEVPVAEVEVGETVIVRPGEKIPAFARGEEVMTSTAASPSS